MKGLSSFLTLNFSYKQPPFILEWDQCHCQENIMRSSTVPIATFLAPSFWMNLPSKSQSHFQKWHLMKLWVKGLHTWIGFKNDFLMEGKDLFFLMWLQPTLSLSILVVRIGINRR